MSNLRWFDSETSQLHLEKDMRWERQNLQSPLDKYSVNPGGKKKKSLYKETSPAFISPTFNGGGGGEN